jgi:uncharacterized membrane protein YfcA
MPPAYVLFSSFNIASIHVKKMDLHIIIYIIVGFVAQLIDGSMGMAYGVSASTFLISVGIPPAAASASLHTAEIFTTAVSGFSHFRFGNVDKQLFKKLIIPGVLGGIMGAYLLVSIPAKIIKPVVAVYLLIIGLVILMKAIRNQNAQAQETPIIALGLVGGFMDAAGGGGWGPIVTSTLLARGNHPRFTIGSVNASEFFVTTAEVATFIVTIGLVHWDVIIGLIVGGVVAAPFGAYLCKRINPRTMMIIVGLLIISLSARTIVLALG